MAVMKLLRRVASSLSELRHRFAATIQPIKTSKRVKSDVFGLIRVRFPSNSDRNSDVLAGR